MNRGVKKRIRGAARISRRLITSMCEESVHCAGWYPFKPSRDRPTPPSSNVNASANGNGPLLHSAMCRLKLRQSQNVTEVLTPQSRMCRSGTRLLPAANHTSLAVLVRPRILQAKVRTRLDTARELERHN